MGITRGVVTKSIHSGTVLGRPDEEGEIPVHEMNWSP